MSQQIELQQNISNDDTAKLPSLQFEGRIVIVDSEEQIAAACEDLSRHPIIGFDTETRPSFKAGVSFKVGLIQLSTPNCCYLFRINKIPLDREILRVLENPNILKIGADVIGDIRGLRAIRHFKDRGFIDLQSIVSRWGIAEKSLRKMSAIVLGYRISKAQRLSNWEATTLTPPQQQYAATDAWACIEIFNKLQTIPHADSQPSQQEEIESMVMTEDIPETKREKTKKRPFRRRRKKSATSTEVANTQTATTQQ
ncbi:MAG: 3'-5' exonuclease [Rikenellaceae bacterium]